MNLTLAEARATKKGITNMSSPSSAGFSGEQSQSQIQALLSEISQEIDEVTRQLGSYSARVATAGGQGSGEIQDSIQRLNGMKSRLQNHTSESKSNVQTGKQAVAGEYHG